MIAGGSSGGICAFTAAWLHPDLFRRVFSAVGTYVAMRGGDTYPGLIRKTEPKPIRIFLQDGEKDTYNALFANWHTQNLSMEESLCFAGYDVNHSWGMLGHEGTHATSIFPDVMRWMWRDYPKPISAGVSGNSVLNSTLLHGHPWQSVPLTGPLSPTALAVDPNGSLCYADADTCAIYRFSPDATTPAASLYTRLESPASAEAFGRDGTLYIAQIRQRRIMALSPTGKRAVVATGIAAYGLTVLADGSLYAVEPGAHTDQSSKIWHINAMGRRTLVDSGLHHATGIVAAPGGDLLFVAEGSTHWIYTYKIAPDGTLRDKQRFYWLHTAESSADSDDDSAGTTDLAIGANGLLLAATRMGVQICDRSGLVTGILTFPDGPVTSLILGGRNFDMLTVVCGGKLYTRKINVHGIAGFAVQPHR
jgi:sugar lactone lactonase YvrE